MKTEIFIVTYAKDFQWLVYCLRSLHKYATGFAGVTILMPEQDIRKFNLLSYETDRVSSLRVLALGGDEWPGAGMCWHMAQIMHADKWCPDADYIAHIDPDCVFTGPVTPETFIYQGKPILRYEPFSTIGVRHPGVLRWKECADRCLPFRVENETMRCHPEVYTRITYAAAREQMEARTGMPVDAYIRTCKNDFPQTFCEFVTLGNVAMKLFPNKYMLVKQHNDTVTPTNHLQQFWSHGALDQPQAIWVNGREKTVVPIKMLGELGLL